MNILINNSLNMGRGTVYHLRKPLSGLEKAPIRTSGDEYAGRSGGFVSGQFYSRRPVTLLGDILSTTVAQHQIDRKALSAAFEIGIDLDVLITMPDNSQYYAKARTVKFDMDITHSAASSYKIELLCESHLLYGGGVAPNYGLKTVTVDKLDTSGFVLPIILPGVLTAESFTVAANSGDEDALPIITGTGQYTSPRIYNATTGKMIAIDVATIAGDVFVVDMENHAITVNGISMLQLLSSGDFWALAPGNNNLYFDSLSGSDNATIDFKYRDSYSGV